MKIVVGYDGSDAARRALSRAATSPVITRRSLLPSGGAARPGGPRARLSRERRTGLVAVEITIKARDWFTRVGTGRDPAQAEELKNLAPVA